MSSLTDSPSLVDWRSASRGRSPEALSVPGKVLLTGGYLVLDRSHRGAVAAVSARVRVYAVALGGPGVAVWSPQHPAHESGRPARFEWSAARNGVVRTDQGKPNAFVEKAVEFAVAFAVGVAGDARQSEEKEGLGLLVVADQQFYTAEGKGKTGLGSSACVVAGIVAAVLRWNGLLRVEKHGEKGIEYAHNVAQLAHCAAQGKVGSGFDVSAAFFGSQRYRRFSPECIAGLLQLDLEAKLTPQILVQKVRGDGTGNPWDAHVAEMQLPPLMELMLGDVQGGSETPGMVRKVLQWRQDSPEESNALWRTLDSHNEAVGQLFAELVAVHEKSPEQYAKAITTAADFSQEAWVSSSIWTLQLLGKLRAEFMQIRECLRMMGQAAKVPIEPPTQTDLLDRTMAEKGVVFAGVPGAGGHDAIFVIILAPHQNKLIEIRRNVENAWNRNPAGPVKPIQIQLDSLGLKFE